MGYSHQIFRHLHHHLLYLHFLPHVILSIVMVNPSLSVYIIQEVMHVVSMVAQQTCRTEVTCSNPTCLPIIPGGCRTVANINVTVARDFLTDFVLYHEFYHFTPFHLSPSCLSKYTWCQVWDFVIIRMSFVKIAGNCTK